MGSGKWFLDDGFAPHKRVTAKSTSYYAAAAFATVGAVPVVAVWQYYNGNKWVERELTVAELTAAEVATAEKAALMAVAAALAAAAAQADRVRVLPRSYEDGGTR